MSSQSEEENSQDLSEIEEIPNFDDLSSIFVIGDTHFQKDAFLQGEELIDKSVEAARNSAPSLIVLLGDILDTHETAKNGPFRQAERLIEELSAIAPVYVIMGNHDLINQSQFLTDNHFFNPFKKWPNVTIVDRPIAVILSSGGEEITLIMCPYVAPGRFIEALDTMIEYENPTEWQLANCIFAHQEVRARSKDNLEGATYNGRVSHKGDVWEEEYPPLILGHIHEPCQLGTNVFYVGSARQIASNETPDKRVWNITFDEGELQHDLIDLGLKAKKEVELDYEDIKSFDFGLLERYYVKLKLRGTAEQKKLFQKSQLHAKMVRMGVRISFKPTMEDNPLMINLASARKEEVSFEGILRELVKQKPDVVREVYEEMYGPVDEEEDQEKKVTYELVFED